MAGEKNLSFFLSSGKNLLVNLPPFHLNAASWPKGEKAQLKFEAIVLLEFTINCAKDCLDINFVKAVLLSLLYRSCNKILGKPKKNKQTMNYLQPHCLASNNVHDIDQVCHLGQPATISSI